MKPHFDEQELKIRIFGRLLQEAHQLANTTTSLKSHTLRCIAHHPQTVTQISRVLGVNRQTIHQIGRELVAEKICFYSVSFSMGKTSC